MIDIVDECFHLADLSSLCFDNPVGQLPDTRIRDIGAFAGKNGNRMVRNHGLHLGNVANGSLATN
jgi:hypothetical protein